MRNQKATLFSIFFNLFCLFSVCFRGSDRVSIHPGNDVRSDSEDKGQGRPVAELVVTKVA